MSKRNKIILVLVVWILMVVVVTLLPLSDFTQAVCFGFIAGTCAQMMPDWKRKQKIIAE